MSITITSIAKVEDGTFVFTLNPSTYYDVWLQGARLAAHVSADDTTYTYDGWTDDDEPPPLEFVDYGGTPDSKTYSPRGILQWWGEATADYYAVEQYVDAAWTERTQIPEDGQGYYQYHTAPQTDGSTAQYRVTPYDSEGYAGEPLAFTVSIVCYPAPPVINVTYDAVDGELDVTERT